MAWVLFLQNNLLDINEEIEMFEILSCSSMYVVYGAGHLLLHLQYLHFQELHLQKCHFQIFLEISHSLEGQLIWAHKLFWVN